MARGVEHGIVGRIAASSLVAVILTGGIRDLADVEPLVKAGHVNLFGFARPLMKDTSYVEHLRAEL